MARNPAESLCPNLWPVAGYAPSLGPTGSTLYDLSGNRNTGTITGPTWDAEGLVFDGTDDIVTMGSVLDLSSYNAFSLVAQVKFLSVANETFEGIIARGINLYILVRYQNNRIRVYQHHASGWSFTESGSAITDNDWHSLIGTYDGDTITLYMDGVVSGTPTASGGALSVGVAGTDFILGAYGDGVGADHSNMLMRHALVYSRALTPSEIQQLYIDPLCWLRREDEGIPWYYEAAGGGLNIPLLMQQMNQFNGGVVA